jgi:LuxR family maltose regulon positive regulatory protein
LHLARHFFKAASPAVRGIFDVEAARQAIQFRPLAAPELIDALGDDPRVPLLRIRLALALGDPARAAAMLDRLPPATFPRDRVVRNIVVALTTIDRDVEGATATFTAALLEAQSEDLRRTVIDVAPDVLRLLMSVTPTRGLEPYIDELIAAATTVPAALRTRTATSLVEQLSDREVTVLRYLCSRLTYQEIASALYVSLNTLKTHVKSVYRKLGVASRREAVEVGRQLRLV